MVERELSPCTCLQVRIARIFNTYGPRMLIDDGRVVSNFVAQVLPLFQFRRSRLLARFLVRVHSVF
jgi:nucleoside-diphosphate-sugar epimerase